MWKYIDQPPPPPVPGATLLKPGRDSTQPDIWRIPSPHGDVVWKTFQARGSLSRTTIGAWLTRREARALQRLDGIPGIPRFLRCPEPWTVEMTLLPCEPVPEKPGSLGREYFDQLAAMLDTMHSRAMNHGDLRRKNLLRHPQTGEPALVDFTQSLVFSSATSLLARLLLPRAQRVDRLTLLKIRKWYLGDEHLSSEEHAELASLPLLLRIGRFLKKRVYRPWKHHRRNLGSRSSSTTTKLKE